MRNSSSFYNALESHSCPDSAIRALQNLYFNETSSLKAIGEKKLKSCSLEQATYPFLGIKLNDEFYGSSLARLDFFENYYKEECRSLKKKLDVPFFVGKSKFPMPLSLIAEDLCLDLTQEQMTFRKIEPLSIELIEEGKLEKEHKPLHWFDAPRVDYSLNRLVHYTGSGPEHIQDYVIFVNYQKYIPTFIEYAKTQMLSGAYSDLVGPENWSIMEHGGEIPVFWHDATLLPQMPSYHLKRNDRKGISIINIGVGPSNAKTITDHLAVLRPRFCLMLGHCGSLRAEHSIGDYIIGDDHLMFDFGDQSNKTMLSRASFLEHIFSNIQSQTKCHIGPVVSSCDRNWELRSSKISRGFEDIGAIGIDMEAAMVVQIAQKYGVPAASLLCVSDKPLHREVRLQKMAKSFYQQRLSTHLLDAISVMENIREIEDRQTYFKGPLFR